MSRLRCFAIKGDHRGKLWSQIEDTVLRAFSGGLMMRKINGQIIKLVYVMEFISATLEYIYELRMTRFPLVQTTLLIASLIIISSIMQ